MTPIDYLNQNPLLKTDLSEVISFHRFEGYKNEILAIASLVAFVALAVLGMWWASFCAPEALLLVGGLIGLGLQVVHSFFFHPCKIAANKHWEALALETRVVELMQVPIEDERAFREQIGALPITDPEPAAAVNLGKTFTHAYARYKAVHEQSDAILIRTNRLFQSQSQFSSDTHTPLNYTALRETRARNAIEARQLDDQLAVHEAVWYKLQDQYLEKRMQEIFLVYVMSHPFRSGGYSQVGVCLTEREISHRILAQEFRRNDPFFIFFNQNNSFITRSTLRKAHRGRTNNQTKPSNQRFMKTFLKHDPNKMPRENLISSGILSPV